jgi:hypothetical protein
MRASKPPFVTFLSLGLMALACCGAPALGDAPITLHIANGSTDSLIVTLFDRNLRRRHQQVLSGQVINGNASISITVSADASGQGHVSWKAMTVDRDMRQCGAGEKHGVNDGATVQVSADSACKRR